MKARLCTAKVTSLITHEVPQRNENYPQSSWHHGKSRNGEQKTHKEQICVNKHLLYRRANILNMYNCTER